MLGMKIDAAKSDFFQPEKVTKPADRAKRKLLSRFGAFVRQTASRSLRSRKKASKPGQPPHSHTKVLKRFLYFVYDREVDGVLIGPAKTNQVFFDGDGQPVTGTVPEVLEHGGQIHILEYEAAAGQWLRVDLRSRRRVEGKPTRLRKATIAARPYMRPAFEKEKRQLPPMWKDAIHR